MSDASPVRLRLSRAKGFDMQAFSRSINGLPGFNVSRPSPWGNPFMVGRDGSREDCWNMHRHMLNGLLAVACGPEIEDLSAAKSYFLANWRQLVGHNCFCWCNISLPGKPDHCHAATLIEAVQVMSERDAG